MHTYSANYLEQCFQKFADELAKRQQQYQFSVPQYGDPELGLSIVMTQVGDVA